MNLFENMIRLDHMEKIFIINQENNNLKIETNYDSIILPKTIILDSIQQFNFLLLPSWVYSNNGSLVYFPDQFSGYRESIPQYDKTVYFSYE